MKKIVWFVLLVTVFLEAQSFDAKSLSLANNGSAFLRGLDALTWNPANIATARGNTVELNFISLNSAIYNSSFSLHNYNRYFTEEGHGGYWSRSEKNAILDLIPDDGLNARIDHNTNILGFAINNFAFAFQLEAMGKAQINAKKPLEIALFGESVDTLYSYNKKRVAEGDFYSAAKITMGYAYPLEPDELFDLDDRLPGLEEISVGINLNYYMGIAVGQVEKSYLNARRVNAETVEYNVNVQGRVASAGGGFPAGNGIGFDLGLNTRYEEKWRFSFALKNIFAGITWNGDPERAVFIERDSTNLYEEEEEVDLSFSEDTTMSIGSFRTPLPKSMLIGAKYNFRPDLVFTMDWHQGFDSNFGNSTTPRIGFGTQYVPLNWLAVRGGLSIGGKEGFLLGMGAGLQFTNFQFDLSYALNKGLWPTYSRGIMTAMAIKFMF